jgi:Holliday junction resolvase RusA-like endonuclease
MDPPTKTQQEHRIGKRKNGSMYVYEDRDLKEARLKLYKAVLPHTPEKPFTKAVQLVVKWCFPRGSHSHGSYKTTKPDTDNLNKMLKDEMTRAGFWKDDALVASEVIEKFWTDTPGIYVEIVEIGEEVTA